MNKNYRLLSFRSFFIFFHFYLFSRGLPPAVFFSGGGERLKILYSRRVFFYIQIFSLFFIFTLFHFFYIFYIFRFFHFFFTFLQFSDFFTFLHFYNFTIFPRSLSPWYIQEVCIFYFLKRG